MRIPRTVRISLNAHHLQILLAMRQLWIDLTEAVGITVDVDALRDMYHPDSIQRIVVVAAVLTKSRIEPHGMK